MDKEKLKLVECGCCGFYHREDYCGDCRNDAERYYDYFIDDDFISAKEYIKQLSLAKQGS